MLVLGTLLILLLNTLNFFHLISTKRVMAVVSLILLFVMIVIFVLYILMLLVLRSGVFNLNLLAPMNIDMLMVLVFVLYHLQLVSCLCDIMLFLNNIIILLENMDVEQIASQIILLQFYLKII